MDTTGCPGGWATDNWIRPHPEKRCEVPLAAFFVVLLSFALIKALVVTQIWRFWLNRSYEMKKTRSFIKRRPIVPAILTVVILCYILTIALVGSNVASAANGGGTVLYAFSALFWGAYCSFHVKKYISLGRRLIPLALVQSPDSRSDDRSSPREGKIELSKAAESGLSMLNKLDSPLHVLLSLMGLSLALGVIIALIPGLIFPYELWWAKITFGLVGAFALFLYITLMYHLERLVKATRICGHNIEGGSTSNKLRHAIKIMRTSQLVWFILGNITFLAHLLSAIGVIDLSWIFILCMMSIETSANTFAYLATRSRPKQKHSQNSSEKAVAVAVNHASLTSPTSSFKTLENKTVVQSEGQ